MENEKGTILLVERKSDWHDLLSQVIERCGYNLVYIDQPEEIPNAVNAGPNLILLDLDMLGDRAETVVAELRSDLTTRHIPVICEGTYGSGYKTDRIVLAGAREVLYKPFDLSDLPTILRDGLESCPISIRS